MFNYASCSWFLWDCSAKIKLTCLEVSKKFFFRNSSKNKEWKSHALATHPKVNLISQNRTTDLLIVSKLQHYCQIYFNRLQSDLFCIIKEFTSALKIAWNRSFTKYLFCLPYQSKQCLSTVSLLVWWPRGSSCQKSAIWRDLTVERQRWASSLMTQGLR